MTAGTRKHDKAMGARVFHSVIAAALLVASMGSPATAQSVQPNSIASCSMMKQMGDMKH
jgi:hypothetical protein